jgi:ATP-binding cassette subfamily G (WHITE) protein 2
MSSKIKYKIYFIFSNVGTIIFSIHQPRHSIFELFDTTLLMLHGRIVYFDLPEKMVPYFTELGYPFKEHDNPADFALDVLNEATDASAIECLYEKFQRTPAFSLDTSFSHESSSIQKPDRSFTSDFFYVSQRTLRNALRNSALLAWQIAVAIILGLLTGLLYYQIPITVGSGVQNRLGGIFFIVVNQIFSTATALEPFIKERELFMHVSDENLILCLDI